MKAERGISAAPSAPARHNCLSGGGAKVKGFCIVFLHAT